MSQKLRDGTAAVDISTMMIDCAGNIGKIGESIPRDNDSYDRVSKLSDYVLEKAKNITTIIIEHDDVINDLNGTFRDASEAMQGEIDKLESGFPDPAKRLEYIRSKLMAELAAYLKKNT